MVSELKIHPLASIDSQILYRQFQPLDADTVRNAIVDAAQSVGLPETECELLDISTDVDIFVRCGDLQMYVTQSVPFADDDYLQVALDTFCIENALQGIPSIDEDITACAHISVQKNDPNANAAQDMDSTLTGFELTAFGDAEECLHAMKVAKKLVSNLVDASEPESVFWGPSTFLLETEKFKRLAAADNPLLLYLHCHVYSKDDPDTGQRLSGAVAAGSQWLIGSIVEFKPCPLPPEYLVERIFDFVSFCFRTGNNVSDGDTFGRDENEAVRILVQPSEDGGPARIELKVEHNPGLGVRREDLSEIRAKTGTRFNLTDEGHFDDEEEELDPEDPVDAAILERLAEIKEEEDPIKVSAAVEADPVPALDAPQPVKAPETVQATADVSVEETPEPEADSEKTQPHTPQTERRPRATRPATQRMSMAELRNFAMEAQVSQQHRDTAPKRRGFIGKLFGRKTS